MLKDSEPIAEAVTVITARGHTVEADDDFGNWRVDSGDIPGRERRREAALVLVRLEADGLAIREEGRRQIPRWRALPVALAALRPDSDPET